jgi:hypothetical protein
MLFTSSGGGYFWLFGGKVGFLWGKTGDFCSPDTVYMLRFILTSELDPT